MARIRPLLSSPFASIHSRGLAALVCGTLALAILPACKDDLTVVESGAITLSNEVVFDPIDIGKTTRRQLLIENSGLNVVVIQSIAIRQPEGRDNDVFGVEDVGDLRLEPGEQGVITFSYTSVAFDGPRGRAVIDTNVGNYVVELVATQPTARLEWSPNPVQFGRVPAGECDTIDVLLQNAGNVMMDIETLEFPDGTSEFSLSAETTAALPRQLGVAGDGSNSDTWPITVEYCPAEANGDAVNLLAGWFHSDRKEESTVIPVSANGSEPCLAVSPVDDAFSFGEVTVNTTADEVFTLTNCASGASAEPLFIDDIAFVDRPGVGLSDRFSVSELPDFPAEIAPGESTFFVLSYTPTQAGVADRTTISIASNDEVRNPLDIEVTGLGSNNACPIASARCTIRGGTGLPADEIQARPLDVLDCTGVDSSDPDGSIIAFEWAIEGAPAGSTTAFTSAGSTTSSLLLDVQGPYLLRLNVIDDDGAPACEPAYVNVSAAYTEGLSAELTWVAPGDPNPTDVGPDAGADVDLHLLNVSRGCWRAAPWDCYFANQSPEWGVVGDINDNPILNVDDVSTGGPENITIDAPADFTYRVGAHYYDDHGFGPADVTVRIFLGGALAFERSRRLNATDEFWEVADITWAGRGITFLDRVWPSISAAPCP